MPRVSFSSRSSSRWSNSLAGHRRVLRCPERRCRPASRPPRPPPRSKIEPWPRRASSWAFWPARLGLRRAPRASPCGGSPVESSAPHLIRHSIARLLTARESTRSQKSQIDSNGPPPSRAAMIASTAAWPTFLTASRPKRIDLPRDDEAVVGGVDVGRQHLDPHLLAAVDEERDLVLGRHHRGDHRRHVLGRVVRLQVGGAVGDQRVAGGVGLVEASSRPRPSSATRGPWRPRGAVPEAAQPSRNLPSIVAIRSRFFLPTALRRSSASAGREAADLLGDLHQLLLVDAAAVGRLGDRAQARVRVADRGGVALAARVVGDEAHRPRPVEGDERDDVVELGRADLLAARRASRPTRAGRRRPSRRATSISKVFASSSGIASMSISTPRERWMISTASSITSRLRRPRKSIFSRPISSIGPIEYWVTIL